jgi:hypothetical protein
MTKLPLHIKNFNDKVRVMNQTRGKSVTLTSDEARNLHAEIYALLAENARLNYGRELSAQSTNTIEMDGGTF